jgi:hypothetical protein
MTALIALKAGLMKAGYKVNATQPEALAETRIQWRERSQGSQMKAKWMEARLAPHMSITMPQKSRRFPRLATGGLWVQTTWQLCLVSERRTERRYEGGDKLTQLNR